MKKRKKVEDNLILLKENILEKQEQLHDVKVECFIEIQKMEEKVKDLEKHFEIVSQINLKMESMQTKIEDIDKWRNMKKNVPSTLPIVKTYDVRLHTLATNEGQELYSKFEERVRQSLAVMMDVYDKSIMMFKDIFNGPRSISEKSIQFLQLSFKIQRISMK